VRRPTDNALTDWFFGTVKEEKTDVVGSYPDELSAWEEIQHSLLRRMTHKFPHSVYLLKNWTYIISHTLRGLQHQATNHHNYKGRIGE